MQKTLLIGYPHHSTMGRGVAGNAVGRRCVM